MSAFRSLVTDLAAARYGINVKSYGALGDGSTDDTAAFVAAIAAIPTVGTSIGGIIRVPIGDYVLKKPLVLPDRTVLLGDNMSGCIIRAHSTFPHTTLSGGGITLPQATITLSSVTNVPTSGGFCTMLSANGIQTITYTAVSGNTITGCSGGTGAVSAAAVIGFPMVMLGNPQTATGGIYGTRVQEVLLQCSTDNTSANAIPGISGVMTSRAQENAGMVNAEVDNAMHFGFCSTSIVSSGQVAQNWMLSGGGINMSSTAPVQGIGINVVGNGNTFRGADNITINTHGSTQRASTSKAVVINGSGGHWSRLNIENHDVGFYIDNTGTACRSVVLTSIQAGQNLTTLVQISTGSSLDGTSVSCLGLDRYGSGTTNILKDDVNSVTLTDHYLGQYLFGIANANSKHPVYTDSPLMPTYQPNGVATRIKGSAIPADGDHTYPFTGELVLDVSSTPNRLYVRTDVATWKYVALT